MYSIHLGCHRSLRRQPTDIRRNVGQRPMPPTVPGTVLQTSKTEKARPNYVTQALVIWQMGKARGGRTERGYMIFASWDWALPSQTIKKLHRRRSCTRHCRGRVIPFVCCGVEIPSLMASLSPHDRLIRIGSMAEANNGVQEGSLKEEVIRGLSQPSNP